MSRKRSSSTRDGLITMMLADQQRKLDQLQREQSVFSDMTFTNDHEMPMPEVRDVRVTTRQQDRQRMMTVASDCTRDLDSVAVRQKG